MSQIRTIINGNSRKNAKPINIALKKEVNEQKEKGVILDENYKKNLSNEYELDIDIIVKNEDKMEDDFLNILKYQPLLKHTIEYVEKTTNLIPLSAIGLTVLSHLSHHFSKFRYGVQIQDDIITPNLYTLLILESGYGKDKAKNNVKRCFEESEKLIYSYIKNKYDDFERYIEQYEKSNDEEGQKRTYRGYRPMYPDYGFNFSKSTFEGFHTSILDMNAINFGTLQIQSGEFFDTVINSKSATELIEFVKDYYYNGIMISKSIKSREFKSPSTPSPAVCAAFHSAMDLNEKNKEKIIDFAKNGLSRRLLISMSDRYRYNYDVLDTDVNYMTILNMLQLRFKQLTEKNIEHHKTISIDYDTSYYSSQSFSKVFKFSAEAQIFLGTLHNYYLKQLESKKSDLYIIVNEYTKKLALLLHLIDFIDDDEISVTTVKTAFKLFLMYNIHKVKYEEKMFDDNILFAIASIRENPVNRTNLFRNVIKKYNWTRKQKEDFIIEMFACAKDMGLDLLQEKRGKETVYIIEESKDLELKLEDLDEN